MHDQSFKELQNGLEPMWAASLQLLLQVGEHALMAQSVSIRKPYSGYQLSKLALLQALLCSAGEAGQNSCGAHTLWC